MAPAQLAERPQAQLGWGELMWGLACRARWRGTGDPSAQRGETAVTGLRLALLLAVSMLHPLPGLGCLESASFCPQSH